MNPRAQRPHGLIACRSGLWSLTFLLASIPTPTLAQTPLHLRGQVRDASGRSAQAATVIADGPRGEITALSDASGHFALDYPNPGAATDPGNALTLRATARSMESDPIRISPMPQPTTLTSSSIHPQSASKSPS